MEQERDKIYRLIDEIGTTVAANENENGTFRFDALRIRIALEFVQLELEKSIEAYAT